ncbi:MAG: DUF2442 domain-containing protein, partial [Microcystis aeruginosa]
FKRANLRTLRNTLVYRDFTLPTRVINAWIWGAQEHLIATALVIGESLLISRCDFDELEIPFASMPALQRIPLEERENFIIAEDGSYIHWPVVDIHLDIAAFLSVIEPAAKQKFAAIKLKHDQIFGQAIASLRKQHQLRQSDIIGVSERQVRRIEQGEGTKVETLNLFAQAHNMELNDYLDAVAQLIDNTSVDLDSFTHPNIPEIDDLFKLMGTENPVEVIEKKVNSEYISREECN